MIKNVEIFI